MANISTSNVSTLTRWKLRTTTWLRFELLYRSLGAVEWLADRYAKVVKINAWMVGLVKGGWREARKREAGIISLEERLGSGQGQAQIL